MTKIIVSSKTVAEAKVLKQEAKDEAFRILGQSDLREWLIAHLFEISLEDALIWYSYRGKITVDLEEIKKLSNDQLVEELRRKFASLSRQR